MKTKKYIYAAAVFLSSVFSFTACNSLELSPIDFYDSTSYWKTVAQVESYVNGMYVDLRNNSFNRQFLMGEARGGLQVIGTGSQGASTFNDVIKGNTLSGDNPGMSGWGGGLYSNILDCNLLLQNIENKDLHKANQKAIDYLLAQTYGIRALYYFTLYRAYGGVPIVTRVKVVEGKVDLPLLYTERATPKETMDFIKSDLQKSLDYFATAGKDWNNNITWSKAATQMLSAEVYLWSAKVKLGNQVPDAGDLTKAEGYLNEVKGNSRFGLLTDFAGIFTANTTAKANKEIIFATHFADGESTSSVSNFLYADANIVSFYDKNGTKLTDILNLRGTAIQRYEYTLAFWNSFNPKDKRLAATFMEYYDKNGKVVGTVMKKFIGSINSTGARVYDSNEPLYRYADVLLMLAEVENMKGGNPAQYINQIRQRAYGSDWNEATDAYTNGDFKSNEYAILAERDREFVYEGKRWYDICRMKDAIDGKPLAFDNASAYSATPVLKSTELYKVLWPVDKATLNNDPKLKQTPGYKVADQQEEVW